MSADPELVEFIRKHLHTYGRDALREQLVKDSVSAEQIDAAFREVEEENSAPTRGRLALYASAGGATLLALALALSSKKPRDLAPDSGTPDFITTPDMVFHGHYGYMMKLPQGYEAAGSFEDAQETHEVVHLFPKGTDHAHFINEGLYGQLGIMRLDVSPRRVPQGLITLETLQTWVKNRLAQDKATYKNASPTMRPQVVHGMTGFTVNVSEPFSSSKTYLLGEKVYYILTAGQEDALVTEILSGLIEVAPTDSPGGK